MFADLPDVRLHYAIDGPADAPVLVLSNSLGTTLEMWEPQMEALAARWRVLRYDTRGHGRSGVTPGPYSIPQLGRDVVALADRLGIAQFAFCGLSMGGMIGQWLGANVPERLGALALCNTAALIGPVEVWDTRIAKVRAGGMEAVTDIVIARWFTPEFTARAPEKVAALKAQMLSIPPDGYVACCAAVRDMDQRDAAARIGARTLVIAGTHDLASPAKDGRWLADRIVGARYVELDAAHISNVEQPAAFTAALTSFLSDAA
jgi:3-oxoadipate enol-lactonase